MECREVREYLPAYVDQTDGSRADEVDAHLRTCAGCRAELSQYREMQEHLSMLEMTSVAPPAWLVGTLTETVVERVVRRNAVREQAEKLVDPKVVVTGSALIAAGLAGALVMRSRRRRRKTVGRRLREVLSEA